MNWFSQLPPMSWSNTLMRGAAVDISHSRRLSHTENLLKVLNGVRCGFKDPPKRKWSILDVGHFRVDAVSGKGGLSRKEQPIIIFDVMDTIVKDPFYSVVPGFFGMTMDELLQVKHPKSWLSFERGAIDEKQMLNNFFLDGRDYDKSGLLEAMCDHYEYINNMDDLLERLNKAGYEMHICSNYPQWYRLIEDKLQLSSWLNWTFLSCNGPMKGIRKPEAEAFQVIVDSLGVDPSDIILVDDRKANIEGAIQFGMDGIVFQQAEKLIAELQDRGLQF